MKKRYQVFISSTFSDLEGERAAVMRALQKAGYFVSGMELFTSDDSDSWDVIKRVINQADYYVLVIAGRYGSLGPGGLSYTEMEYDYARSKGIPVLAFVHADTTKLTVDKFDAASQRQLKKFRKKVETNHNRSSWMTADELASAVLASVVGAVDSKPGIGWVRGNAGVDTDLSNDAIKELQSELSRVKTERDAALRELSAIASSAGEHSWLVDFASLIVSVSSTASSLSLPTNKPFDCKWGSLFDWIAADLIGWSPRRRTHSALNRLIQTEFSGEGISASLLDESVTTVRDKLIGNGLLDVEMRAISQQAARFEHPRAYPHNAASEREEWKLTKQGLSLMAIRRSEPESELS